MNRNQILLELVIELDFRWPKELYSGVMFFKGERFTIEDFLIAVDKYKKAIKGE